MAKGRALERGESVLSVEVQSHKNRLIVSYRICFMEQDSLRFLPYLALSALLATWGTLFLFPAIGPALFPGFESSAGRRPVYPLWLGWWFRFVLILGFFSLVMDLLSFRLKALTRYERLMAVGSLALGTVPVFTLLVLLSLSVE